MTRSILGLVCLALVGPQDSVQKKKLLNDLNAPDGWIYDDLPASIAQARREAKPLFVVFR